MLRLVFTLSLSNHLRHRPDSLVCIDPFCGAREGFNLFWKFFFSSKPIHTESCPKITPLLELDLDRYLNGSWYVQMQQVNDYQPKNKLFCVTADYRKRSDNLIGVVNSANRDSINGTLTRSTGICAKSVTPKIEGLLSVGSCQLYQLGLDYFTGPYWIIDYQPEKEYVIVMGGVPTLLDPDGSCTTPLQGINGAGLWLMTRHPLPRPQVLKEMLSSLVEKGVTTKYLLPVKQKGCLYSY